MTELSDDALTQKPREEVSIFFLMLGVINLTAQPFSKQFEKRFNITLNEWRVMRTIALNPSISQSGVAYELGMDKMAVSRAVRSLLRRERLCKKAQDGKKREQALTLSKDGQALYAIIAEAGAKRQERLQHGFKPYELAAMRDYVLRFNANARAILEDEDFQ